MGLKEFFCDEGNVRERIFFRGGLFLFLITLAFFGFVYFIKASGSYVSFSIENIPNTCSVKLDWVYNNNNNAACNFSVHATSGISFVGGFIILNTSSDPNFPFCINDNTNHEYSYTHSNLIQGYTYIYRLKSDKASGYGWPTPPSPLSVTINGITSPLNPSSFNGHATSSDQNNQRIDLEWPIVQSLSNYGKYQILRATTTSGTFPSDNIAVDELSSSTYQYNEIASSTYAYRYKIRTYEGGGETGCGRVYSNQNPITIIIPSLPGDLQSTYDSINNKATLTWNAGVGGNIFKIEQKEENGQYVQVGQGSENNVLLGGFHSSRLYTFRVRSCNNENCSDYSNETSFFATNSPQHLEARTLYAYTSPYGNYASIHLVFDNTFQAAQPDYILEKINSQGQRSTSSIFYDVTTSTITTTVTELLDDIYTYRVYAFFGPTPNDVSEYSDPQVIDLRLKWILGGHAWGAGVSMPNTTSGIGWINFNSDDDLFGTGTYNVQINRNSGLFSGLAWTFSDSEFFGGYDQGGYGWLSFNENDLKKCPDDPNGNTFGTPGNLCVAKMNTTTGEVRGWARFLFDEKYKNATAWDGWVSLSSTTVNGTPHVASEQFSYPVTKEYASILPVMDSGKKLFSPFVSLWDNIKPAFSPFTDLVARAAVEETYNYGMTLDVNNVDAGTRSTTFAHGTDQNPVAWAGNVGGWIHFYPSPNSHVVANLINRKPIASNARIELDPPSSYHSYEPQRNGPMWCLQDPYYTVRWNYKDLDGDALSQAKIQFVGDDVEKSGTTSSLGLFVSGDPTNAEIKYVFWNPIGGDVQGSNYIYKNTTETLAQNSNIKVRVSVFDGYDWSDWSDVSDATTTPHHYPPLIDFSWNPSPAVKQTQTKITGTSVHRGGPIPPLTNWVWDFPHGTPLTATGTTSTVIFSQAASSTSEQDYVQLDVTQPETTQNLIVLQEEMTCNITKKVLQEESSSAVNLRRRVFRER